MKSSQAGAQSASQTLRWSFKDSQTQIKSILSGSMSSLDSLDRTTDEAPKRKVTILGRDGRDVTPLSLHQAEPGCIQPGAERLFLDELFSSSESEHSSGLSSSSLVGSSQGSSLSLNKETEDNFPQLDRPANLTAPRDYHLELSLPPPVVLKQEDDFKQPVTEKMLSEEVGICLTETHIISLFEQPNTFVSEDAGDAEAQKERNSQYAELCKNRMGNLKYVERPMLTINEATKDKQTQSDTIATVDKGTYATVWDIYDSFCDQSENPESAVNTGRGQETSREERNISSTVYAEGTREMCRNSSNSELDPQLIMMSESFQHSLLLMERVILGSIFQPQLAAYRQLPILEDPDRTEMPETKKQSAECEESSSSPALKHLWAFSFELTRNCSVTCMAWNKKDPNILAVGYSHCDNSDQKRGLICCWSLKNLKWPERIFHCDSCVTSIDFSAINPSHLAVGMSNGTVAIYNVHFRYSRPRIGSISECYRRARLPVWQVQWTKPEKSSLRKTMVESLISVSAVGCITEWFLCSGGLDGRDLMQLKKTIHLKRTTGTMKRKILLSTLTPGLCIDFHPVESTTYLVGTGEGHIHKCSLFNDQYFLDTYKAHVCPVNHVEWSPFSANVFLSCSSDSQIQLWRQDHSTPVMTFTTTQRVVLAARWSPNQSTVFAAIFGQQVELWDLNQNIVKPIIVHHAAPGVRLTSLLFATDSDCVLVGDSDGQVTVYEIKNLRAEAGEKVDTLEDIVFSELSRQLKAGM